MIKSKPMALCWHSDLSDHSGVARTGSNLQDMIVVVIVINMVKLRKLGSEVTWSQSHFVSLTLRLKPNHRH